ncbi:hypothetical protein K8I61_10115 [bacterium]|nr:hypothetical protein [bacterium]
MGKFARIPTALSVVAALFVAPASGASVTGVVYHDADKSSRTAFKQAIDASDAPIGGAAVRLLGAGLPVEFTVADGSFAFVAPPGTYLLETSLDRVYESTTNNRPRRLPEAVREGHVTVVSLGDSIGREGSPPYPDRLAAHLSGLADVTLHNIHYGGSTTFDWLPGSERGHFEDRFLPLAADADLITVTIGGNDMQVFLPPDDPYDVIGILKNFFAHPEYALEIPDRVVQVLDAVRDAAPQADIVYIVYPNFPYSNYWYGPALGLGPMIAWWGAGAMDWLRERSAALDDIIVADTLGALSWVWLDDYLIDEVHPSPLGAQVYADIIFDALGGVVIDEAPTPGPGAVYPFGFYAPGLAAD